MNAKRNSPGMAVKDALGGFTHIIAGGSLICALIIHAQVRSDTE